MAFAVGLAALALFAALDRVDWSLRASLLDLHSDDSARHALTSVGWALHQEQSPSPLGLRLLGMPGYYPGLAYWTALPLQRLWGPSGEVFRASLSLYDGLLALGTGLLATRLFGRWLGLAGAALTLTFPVLWGLRSQAMLDVPLAAAVAMTLALLPVDPARSRPWMAVGCGVALGAGMLAKQSLVFLAAPAVGWVLLIALWRAAPAGPRRLLAPVATAAALAVPAVAFVAGWPFLAVWITIIGAAIVAIVAGHRGLVGLRDLALVGALATALCGTWYARSLGPILTGLESTSEIHPMPGGFAGFVRIIGYLEYIWHGFLAPPVAWLSLAGLASVPFLVRKRPLLVATLLALIGGYVGFTRFPDVHGRHLAPLVAPLTVLALAPLALLRRASRPASAVGGMVLVAASLVFAASWRWPDFGSPSSRLRRTDTDIGGAIPAPDLAALSDRLFRPPTRWRWTAMVPPTDVWPLPAAFDEALADARARSGQSSPALTLLANDPLVEFDGLLLIGLERYDGGDVRAIAPNQLGELSRLSDERSGSWFYAFDLVPRGKRASPPLVAAGFEELGRHEVGAVERRGALDMVLLRRADAPGTTPGRSP